MLSLSQQRSRKTTRRNKGKRVRTSNPGDRTVSRSTPTTKFWSVRGEHRPAYELALGNDNVPHKIIQTVDRGTILTTSSTSDVFFATYFVASELDQYSTFAAIFDQYRIDFIELWVTPAYQDTVGPNPNSRYLTVVDYDDAVALSGTNLARQYQNCTDSSCYEGVYRRFQPHTNVANGGNATLGGTGLRNVPASWQDCAYGSTYHFGFKMGAFASNVTTYFNLVVRYHMSWRNVF